VMWSGDWRGLLMLQWCDVVWWCYETTSHHITTPRPRKKVYTLRVVCGIRRGVWGAATPEKEKKPRNWMDETDGK